MIATITHDPRPASSDHEPRNDSRELRDKNNDESSLELPSQSDDQERTDYSYDPDEDFIEMHLGKKMEENY